MSKKALLQIRNLTTAFQIKDDFYAAVDNVTLNVNKNEVLAIVGESGSGKSALANTIMGLHNPERTKIEGEINFKGENLVKLPVSKLNKIRGDKLSMIFQDPLTALNPLMIIGEQIGEALLLHRSLTKAERKKKSLTY